MNRIYLLLLVTILCGGAALAQEIGGEGAASLPTEKFDEILLKDGTLLRGTVLEERADLIVFESTSLGRLEVFRANIERIALRQAHTGVISDPDQNTIMFCPTPATLPKGDSYFRDFQLFLLNFGFGLTDAFDLSIGTFFPISSELLMLSVGGKLRIIDRELAPVGLALTGSFTLLEDAQLGAVGFVAGIGDREKSLNLAVNYAFEEDGGSETVYQVGGDIQTGRRSKLFAEYISFSSLLEDEDEDLRGFINVGFRLFGEGHSFSLSGFRPLSEDNGSFIAFPMIMYSNHW